MDGEQRDIICGRRGIKCSVINWDSGSNNNRDKLGPHNKWTAELWIHPLGLLCCNPVDNPTEELKLF